MSYYLQLQTSQAGMLQLVLDQNSLFLRDMQYKKFFHLNHQLQIQEDKEMASYSLLSKSIQQGTFCKTYRLLKSKIQQYKLLAHQLYLCLLSIHTQEDKCNRELKMLVSIGFLNKPQALLQDLNIGCLRDKQYKLWTRHQPQKIPVHIFQAIKLLLKNKNCPLDTISKSFIQLWVGTFLLDK